MAMPYTVAIALALILLASPAATRRADAEIPTAADSAACNLEAPHTARAGTVSPTRNDHARADRARAGAVTANAVVESPDPQIHGMEAEGAKNAMYQAAYRTCMRRKGF